ncbi:MAG: PhoH family protein [Emcibacter sp.]|nr:PhoH family protein [Emcibacter sp.]
MGKKTRRAKSHKEFQNIHTSNIRPLYRDRDTSWDPLQGGEESREHKYTRKIKPQSENQRCMMEAIDQHNVVVAVGPAGTGKTYVAIAKAVEALEEGQVARIVLSRPAVEAGENLGYLPGALDEKLAPYLRPLYDCLSDRMGLRNLKKFLHDGTIEIAPIAYMRGRTLNNAYVVVDEAQNCTYAQLKMLLTRLGWQSTMVLTGDPDQSDLLNGLSGLNDITGRLETLEDVAVVHLADKDIVRHPLVAAMLTVI